MSRMDIAIIGMDCIFPNAKNIREFLRLLVRGEDCIREIPEGRLNGMSAFQLGTDAQGLRFNRGGFLPAESFFKPLDYQVMPQIVSAGDPDQFLMLQVADRALRDARISEDATIRKRTDLILGRGGYMTNQMSELFLNVDLKERIIGFVKENCPDLSPPQFHALADKLQSLCPAPSLDNISTCIPNLVASRTANRLDLRGAAYTIDAACASSLIAVEHAVRRLMHHESDLAIAGGIHVLQTPSFWSIFSALGVMSPSQQIRPFDQDADGLLIGEGVGAIVLKRLEDAIQAEDDIYAVIRGIGVSNDGKRTSLLTPCSAGQIEALQRAYGHSQIDPGTIGFLEAHGTGTAVGDAVEMETIKAVFGTTHLAPTRAMGSVKSMIGHTMPAAGIASLIKTVLSLNHKCLFPSLHCEKPHEFMSGAPFYVNQSTRPWLHCPDDGPRRAGVNAFGFGGVNCHIVLEEVHQAECTKPSLPSVKRDYSNSAKPRAISMPDLRRTELFLIAASSLEEMLLKLNELEALLGSWVQPAGVTTMAVPSQRQRTRHPATLLDIAFMWNEGIDFECDLKLALVSEGCPELRSQIESVRKVLDEQKTPTGIEGVYFSKSARQPIGKVAGIFPGLGFPGLVGNYPTHLMTTCLLFPEVRAEFDKLEPRDRNPLDPTPTSLIFSPPASYSEALRTRLKQRLAPISVQEDGQEVECSPDDRNIAAAGVTISNWVSWLILKELEVPFDMACGQSQGEMAAMCAADMMDFDEIVPRFWIDRAKDYTGRGCLAFATCNEESFNEYVKGLDDVSIAIHVAPEMLIAGGPTPQIETLITRVKQDGRIASLLPYPPIHTPRLRHMRAGLTSEFAAKLTFRKPKMKVYSSITQQPFPDQRDKIWELMLSNLDSPVRFWQSLQQMHDDGARLFVQVGGGSMAANIKTVLQAENLVATAVDVDYREPMTQLQHLCAVLFTNGIKFNPSYLYKYSGAKRVVFSPVDSTPELALPLRMDWVPLATHRPNQVAAPPIETTRQISSVEPPITGPSCRERVKPFIGRVSVAQNRSEVVNELTLDLHEHLFLHDHAVVDDGCGKPIENRLAVLPLAMCIEIMSETASLLIDKAHLIGFDNIQALRWIDFPDIRCVELKVVAKQIDADADGSQRVAIECLVNDELRASATALFSNHFPLPTAMARFSLENERDWPITAAECYRQRHMFHGPRFHCVSELTSLADNGLNGKVTIQPTDKLFASHSAPEMLNHPVTIDGFLQLSGMWAIVHGFYVLPSRISKLRYFSPTPPDNSNASLRLETLTVDLANRSFVAQIEAFDDAGNPWMTIEGLREWIFDYTNEYQDTQRQPKCFCVAQEIKLGSNLHGARIDRAAFRNVNLDWAARVYLHQSEYEAFDKLPTLNRKWEWLLGRVAAKDALRFWTSKVSDTQEMAHPATIIIEQDPLGKPRARMANSQTSAFELSIAHAKDCSVAVVSKEYCGVDVELIRHDALETEDCFSTEAERELFSAWGNELAWSTLIWCAKAAVGKLLGMRLAGRLDDFEVMQLHGNEMLVYQHSTQTQFPVSLNEDNGMWIASAASSRA